MKQQGRLPYTEMKGVSSSENSVISYKVSAPNPIKITIQFLFPWELQIS
jgi:hypothetical protein